LPQGADCFLRELTAKIGAARNATTNQTVQTLCFLMILQTFAATLLFNI
jgi:hypothetical protein